MPRLTTLARIARVGRMVDELERVEAAVPSLAARSAALLLLQSSSTSLGRDPSAIATGSPLVGLDQVYEAPAPSWPVSRVNPPVRSLLSEVEDGRYWSPDLANPSRSIRGSRARLVAAQPSRAGGAATRAMVDAGIAFRIPGHVAVCVRRRMRRRVLFAKGKGGGAHARPRRKPSSNYWC